MIGFLFSVSSKYEGIIWKDSTEIYFEKVDEDCLIFHILFQHMISKKLTFLHLLISFILK